jgi:alcohol dehydrogenase class IV
MTAATGMDALTQLIEPFLCARANPMTDALCREALPCVARALPRVFKDGADVEARAEMALGSLFGGLALANAGLGAVHGFAAPIGGMFPAPHGAACAALLPHVLEANITALTKRRGAAPIEGILERFDELGRLLTGRESARGMDAIDFTRRLGETLEIPRLRDFGIQPEHFEELCEKAGASSSMKANPAPLTREELREILARAA